MFGLMNVSWNKFFVFTKQAALICLEVLAKKKKKLNHTITTERC